MSAAELVWLAWWIHSLAPRKEYTYEPGHTFGGSGRKVLGMLFKTISIDEEGIIQEVELQEWARPLFADLVIVNGDHECPQGTSNARHVATLAGLEGRRESPTALEND